MNIESYLVSSNTSKEEFLKWLAIGAGFTVAGACVGVMVVKSNKDKQKDGLMINAGQSLS